MFFSQNNTGEDGQSKPDDSGADDLFEEQLDSALQVFKSGGANTDLLKEKNAAYGNTALSPLGIFSKLGAAEAIKARIDDKLARIANKGLNDDTEDTARDLIGYLLLLLMAIERKDS